VAPRFCICGSSKVTSMDWQFSLDTVHQVMTEQPDCCHRCGSRLVLLEIVSIDDRKIFVSECLECKRTIPVVEDDFEARLDV
jgi:hypothetical protein